ncbi:hypothetical protein HanXRQr2_Chr08g0329221 [Helianthus annuus]|uniref:Uncharacterized protein n=1 Tax=Helianthus annuus TaxID=4232 RepID=A0A9K3NCA7_HELAN|nr:hypothetical protein HanXRQr2_Chr08g0329221 [Helianthus annuus]
MKGHASIVSYQVYYTATYTCMNSLVHLLTLEEHKKFCYSNRIRLVTNLLGTSLC